MKNSITGLAVLLLAIALGLSTAAVAQTPPDDDDDAVLSVISAYVRNKPTVALTAPANNSSYIAPANITLTASASSPIGITKVEFYNGALLLGSATTSPYTYTWTNVAVGSYTLTAKATNTWNAATVSSPVAITVHVNYPPTVSLTAPANNSTYTALATINFAATASDSDGTVSRVDFLANGSVVGSKASMPYQYSWMSVAAGSYQLAARATDNLATSTTSPAIAVVVANPPTVTLIAPSPGQVVAPGTVVTVTANPIADTAHGRSVANVVLAAKNSSGIVVWSMTTYPCTSNCGGPLYTATWTTSTAGVFTLTATVTDSVGATGVSPPITLTVDVPPTVSVTSDRSSYPAPATVYLTATATATVSTIQSVKFYDGASLIGSGTPGANSTYTLTWSTSAIGTHSVTARATDNFNVSTTSSAITITIVQGGPSTVYYHNDFAGSPLAATDQSGNVLWSESYAPYGERYFNQDTTTRNGVWFAGKPTEDSSGLSYFGGRWYNPIVGRFYSVDPIRFRDSNPLSFNRYAYGNNNPYRFIDPDGSAPVAIIIEAVLVNAAAGAVAAGATNAAIQGWQTGTVQLGGAGGVFDAASDGAVIGTIFGLAGGIRAGVASGAARAATPEKLYHYTGADPSKIATGGLKPGASGEVFTTPAGNLSPLQAHIDLALPPNRGLPNHLLEIDVRTLRKMGIEVPEARQVGRSSNMPGGGTEVVFPHALPPEAIKVIQ